MFNSACEVGDGLGFYLRRALPLPFVDIGCLLVYA